jgi:glycosyltransferase involved in cell wall biosynthesis
MPRVLLAFEPPDGGVAEAVRQIALGVDAHGWEVEVAGPSEAVIHPALERAGIRVHRLTWERQYGRPDRDARAGAHLRRLLRRGRFDVVHAHSSKAGAIARPAAAASGIPVVYSPHCFAFLGPVSAARRVLTLQIERVLGRITARLVCVCEHERRIAVQSRVAPADRVEVVFNGTEPCDATVTPDRRLSDLRGNGVLAAAIAVMRPQKRLDVLVDAAPRILARVPEARLAIVGEGPLEHDLRARAAALGLDEHPRFAFLPFTRPVDPYLHALDAFVLCSEREAFPIGILEAMACGVPQVCSNVGGVSEAVDAGTGRLVAATDPGALANALVEVLGDPELRRSMAGASVERHAERFSVDRMVAQTSAVYSSVITPRRSRRRACSTS